MNTQTTNEMKYQLEQMIDKLTTPQVFQLISEICYEKADHLRENWQDEKAAKLWDKNGNMIHSLSVKIYS
jgi:hypothetical protein